MNTYTEADWRCPQGGAFHLLDLSRGEFDSQMHPCVKCEAMVPRALFDDGMANVVEEKPQEAWTPREPAKVAATALLTPLDIPAMSRAEMMEYYDLSRKLFPNVWMPRPDPSPEYDPIEKGDCITASAKATIADGAITSIAVTNAGSGWSDNKPTWAVNPLAELSQEQLEKMKRIFNDGFTTPNPAITAHRALAMLDRRARVNYLDEEALKEKYPRMEYSANPLSYDPLASLTPGQSCILKDQPTNPSTLWTHLNTTGKAFSIGGTTTHDFGHDQHMHQIDSNATGAHDHGGSLYTTTPTPTPGDALFNPSDLKGRLRLWNGEKWVENKNAACDCNTYKLQPPPFYSKPLGESQTISAGTAIDWSVTLGPTSSGDNWTTVAADPNPADYALVYDPSNPCHSDDDDTAIDDHPEVPTDLKVPDSFRVVEKYRVIMDLRNGPFSQDEAVWDTIEGARRRIRQLMFAREDVLRCEIESVWERK